MSDNRTIIDVLVQVAAFAGLDREELAGIAEHCELRDAPAGEQILTEGQAVPGFFIVKTGTLKVYLPQTIRGKRDLRVTHVNLNSIQAGDCFGEYALVSGQVASASVVAETEAQLLFLSASRFLQLFDGNEHMGRVVYRNLLGLLVTRLKRREQEYDAVLLMGG